MNQKPEDTQQMLKRLFAVSHLLITSTEYQKSEKVFEGYGATKPQQLSSSNNLQSRSVETAFSDLTLPLRGIG